jgi:hypothetical protein
VCVALRMLLFEQVQPRGSSITLKVQLGSCRSLDSDAILSEIMDVSGTVRDCQHLWASPFLYTMSKTFSWLRKTFNERRIPSVVDLSPTMLLHALDHGVQCQSILLSQQI